MLSARDALEWMKGQASDYGELVLFRGQNRMWPSIKPSITRDDEQTMWEMWKVCRWFHAAAAFGITGYSIPKEHDRLAILQHYIGRSPVIDLTGKPEIALYFALLGAEPGRECVVYSVDRSASASSDVVFPDHSFLALPSEDGGLTHRWLRQDGYSVGPTEWRNLDVVQHFDLLQLPGVDSRTFMKGPADDELIRHLGDLEDTSSDPLALKVRGAVVSLVQALDLMTPGIEKILQASKTRDPDAELAAEIDFLLSLASTLEMPGKLLVELQTLRAAVGKTYWNTAFDATLDSARKEVHRLLPPSTGNTA